MMDYTTCISQLQRDKTSLLEGYIIEHFTQSRYFERNYTTGWWYASRENKKYFFVFKPSLLQLDKEFMSFLSQFGKCWHVQSERGNWIFCKEGNSLTAEEFLENEHISSINNPLNADNGSKYPQRHAQCIRFFDLEGMLEKISEERHFANDFLTPYFDKRTIINFDYIIKAEDVLSKGVSPFCIIETKYKFPMSDGHFGLNRGEMELYQELLKQNVHVCSLILLHQKNDSNESPLSYLLNPVNEVKYVCRMMKNDDIGLEIRDHNNRGGAIFGGEKGRNQQYYCIPSKEFEEISSSRTALSDFVTRNIQMSQNAKEYYCCIQGEKCICIKRNYRGYKLTDKDCIDIINRKKIQIRGLVSQRNYEYNLELYLPENAEGMIKDNLFKSNLIR